MCCPVGRAARARPVKMGAPPCFRAIPAPQDWIEELTGCTFKGDSFAESLKDGVILCK
jgi:hypothetical protein